MPLLALFKRDRHSAARSQSRVSVGTAGSSTDIHDDYVLPPIPSSRESWPDTQLFAHSDVRPPSTLRLVSPAPTPTPTQHIPVGSSLPSLGYPFPDSAASPTSSQSLQSASPPKSHNKLSKTPQTPSSKSQKAATTPHSKRPSLFSWASSKSIKNASNSTAPSQTKSAKSKYSSDQHSFNLKSFRHVAPPRPAQVPAPPVPSPMPTRSTPVTTTSQERLSETPYIVTPRPTPMPAQPSPGFQVTSRPRGNSTHSLAESSSSQTVTVSAFRQAARRSSTNLVASPIDDSDDLPTPPPLLASERPIVSPLRTNTPPSSFRGSMENIRTTTLPASKSSPNATPLQSISGATRRYSGALSSGPNGAHVRQPALVSPSVDPKQQTKHALPITASPTSEDDEFLDRQSTITQSTARPSKARSELGHGDSRETSPPTPKANAMVKLPTRSDLDSEVNSGNSFYRRQRASLSTGALPTAAAQVRRSTGVAAVKQSVAPQWHDDTDSSEEEENDSDSSGDDTPLVTYMTKSRTSLISTPAETSRPNPAPRPPPQRKQTLVDINAPSTFHTADTFRNNRKGTQLGRDPSLRSSRSEENLPASTSKSYAGPMRPPNPPSNLRSSRVSNIEKAPTLTNARSRPSMVSSSTDPLFGSERISRASVFPNGRPFRDSPTSSTSNGGDSSSGILPSTPRDGSEISTTRPNHRKSGSVTFADQVGTKDKVLEQQQVQSNVASQEESRRRERRRSEAKNAIALGNVVNGPGPVPDSDEDEYPIHPVMNMPVQMQLPSTTPFPSHATDMWNTWTRQSMMNAMPAPSTQQFMVPTPPPGADMHFLAAHQQAMMIAKQTYQMAVAQQAMAAAGDEWERNSNVSGLPGWGGGSGMFPGASRSVYAGSVIGGPSSSYGGGWASRSVYGESFGPSMTRSSFLGQPTPPVPPSSFNRTAALEGSSRPRARSGVQEAVVGPPSSWKKR